MDTELLRSLATPNDTKILLCVVDGLGGLPDPETRRSELEEANIPNLNRMADESVCGLTLPVGYGVTPGSGPGHLALFGYDPLKYEVGRGVLEALGIDFDLQPTDVAARGNFCTLDAQGNISDRRAGRVATEVSTMLCERLRQIKLPGVEVFVEPVREHRFVLVLRGEGLGDALSQTDPEREGVPPLPVHATADDAPSKTTADLANQFIAKARELISDQGQANGLLLRGFAKFPNWPRMPEVTQMRAGAFAVYPMYRGLAKLVGMTVAPGGGTQASQLEALSQRTGEFDFMFYHFKKADAAGEDGDFRGKIEALQEFDSLVPALRELDPDVMMVAGDHSTPAQMAAHSWHPVPFMLWSRLGTTDGVDAFNESACRQGSLGIFPAKEALSLAMAHAGRLMKFGA
ncbi:MAG TPA: 2,3-bisphosphoglycerate-independent phosphoglycerate mutase [Dehalococcoidia bacterium]|nr:2,3-bisphosphoglycerate-independent phosphoglycerate mutase [Dehalococcoidia bacterium]